MKIDLRTCKPGQKLKTRNGNIAVYDEYRPGSSFPHRAYVEGDTLQTFRDNGKFCYNDLEDQCDVVEILSLIDLNTCKPGQKVKIRDGRTGRYVEKISGNGTFTHRICLDGEAYERSYTNTGEWSADGNRSDFDVVEILPLDVAKISKLNVFVEDDKHNVYELQTYEDKYVWGLVKGDNKLYAAVFDNLSDALYYSNKHKLCLVKPVTKVTRVETIEYVRV